MWTKKIPKSPLELPNRKWAKTKTHIERPWIGVPNWFWWLVLWTLEKIPSLWSTELSPSQNIMFYQWRPKDMGWHKVNLWSHISILSKKVYQSLCAYQINPKFCEKEIVGKTWSETAEFVTIVLVFKQWILQYLGPASIFGWTMSFGEDVTHIYATNVGGGKSRGIAM